MLNPGAFYNSRPDGFGVLEIHDENPAPGAPRRFVPLTRTELSGNVAGPLATLALAQTFSLSDTGGAAIEALYRFPLPGDAAVTGVRVQFGDVEIRTELKERESAEADYQEAKRTGRQAALVTRESPDVFTLAISGIRAGQDVLVRTEYVQAARPEGKGWSLRVPLTTSPRYVRKDEANSRHASGQPLAILRDPGHRFVLDLAFSDADRVSSGTHAITVEGGRVRLRDGEVIPDRDCVLTWGAAAEEKKPALRVWTHADSDSGKVYFLALCAPPKWADAKKVPREVVLLVDHSGSMQGAKWEAADWAVERFLAGLAESDAFALGLFHDTTKWFAERTRKATPDAVRDAVKYLKANRDQGGTELGVALEQALDRPRTSDTPSRHVLILTDAEVSDSGRVLRLADSEFAKADRRRVSVLCIDAAPNAALASELAERGGGVSRFLTSNPDEDDVTTALDEVLADWSAPVLTGLTLEVNRAGAEAAGRVVALVAPGASSSIDIGDLPAGRPVWVIGRAPRNGEPLSFKLRTGAEVVAECRVDVKEAAQGLKALFGADRVRRLEYVMNANYSGDDLCAELARLGYESAAGASKVYAENAREATSKVVRELLVRESLAAGVPSSETAFVAVRSEVGQVVSQTRIVANALPHGWSNGFAAGGLTLSGASLCYSAPVARCAPPAPPSGVWKAMRAAPLPDSTLSDYSPPPTDADMDPSADFDAADDSMARSAAPPPARKAKRAAPPPTKSAQPAQPSLPSRLLSKLAGLVGAGARKDAAEDSPAPTPSPSDIRVSVAAKQHAKADGAVLFDSASGSDGQLTFLSLAFADKAITASTLDMELTLLLFVGDLAAPRARVKLVDVLRQGGRRPLNLRRGASEPVRLVLSDPSGAWAKGVPAMEIVLGWTA